MDVSLAQKAIDLALQGKWIEAIDVNEEILKENPRDVDAFNRIAKARSDLV